ncbi:MAG: hypothetical protein ABIG90_03135 [bacterium]
MNHNYKIALSGAAAGKRVKKAEEKAEAIGKAIAETGCILITGATSGVPYYGAQGAKKAGGIVIGFSPAATKLAHIKSYRLPVDYHDVIVYTGFEYAGRNLLMTRAADAVIVVSGRIGTLNEFTIAFEDNKVIGVLLNSFGVADDIAGIVARAERGRGKIVYNTDPAKLVKEVIQKLEEDEKKESNLRHHHSRQRND